MDLRAYVDLLAARQITDIPHHNNVASTIFMSSLLHSSVNTSPAYHPPYSNNNVSAPKQPADSNIADDNLETFVPPRPPSPRNIPHQLRLVLRCMVPSPSDLHVAFLALPSTDGSTRCGNLFAMLLQYILPSCVSGMCHRLWMEYCGDTTSCGYYEYL